jgi:hypothetical protein
MHKTVTTLALALLFTLCATAQTIEVKKNTAEVPQYSGLYVYVFCKPIKEYTYITTMKKMVAANSYVEAFGKYAAIAKKEYPEADAIIFNDVSTGFNRDRFDVIKFKE